MNKQLEEHFMRHRGDQTQIPRGVGTQEEPLPHLVAAVNTGCVLTLESFTLSTPTEAPLPPPLRPNPFLHQSRSAPSD